MPRLGGGGAGVGVGEAARDWREDREMACSQIASSSSFCALCGRGGRSEWLKPRSQEIFRIIAESVQEQLQRVLKVIGNVESVEIDAALR